MLNEQAGDLLAAVGVVACLMPAVRAPQIDPAIAIRAECGYSMTSTQLPSFEMYALLPDLLNLTRRGVPPTAS